MSNVQSNYCYKEYAPLYISTDHDPFFQFHLWNANLSILEIEEIKSIYRKKLNNFTDCYNNHRVHASLNGTLPAKCGEEKQSPLAALTNYGTVKLTDLRTLLK